MAVLEKLNVGIVGAAGRGGSFRAGLEANVRWFRDNWERIRASARF